MDPVEKANTPTEVVDVVNEKNDVIGTATKQEVNSNPQLIHREVGVLVYDQNRRVLFQQRSRYKKIMPLFWTLSVAGHVPSGMTVEAAAHMELQEELGFDTDLVYSYTSLERTPNETFFCSVFLARYAGQNIQFATHEIEAVQWMDLQAMTALQATGALFEEISIQDIKLFWEGKLPHQQPIEQFSLKVGDKFPLAQP